MPFYSESQTLSIIVPARNEAAHIISILNKIKVVEKMWKKVMWKINVGTNECGKNVEMECGTEEGMLGKMCAKRKKGNPEFV